MSHGPLFASETRKSAYIRDNALILYFETAETPLVARFDLDSLAQANFEVTKKDEFFALVLRDFSGQRQEITTFANKADAHQALYAILQALLSYGETQQDRAEKPSLFWKFVKGLFIGLVIALIAIAALILFSKPVSQVPATDGNEAAAVQPEQVQDPSQNQSVAEPQLPDVPQGEPMDMDQMIMPDTGMTDPMSVPTE